MISFSKSQAVQVYGRYFLYPLLCSIGNSLAPPPVPEVWTLPEIASMVLGCLLGIVLLVLAVQWCHIRAISMGKEHTGVVHRDGGTGVWGEPCDTPATTRSSALITVLNAGRPL